MTLFQHLQFPLAANSSTFPLTHQWKGFELLDQEVLSPSEEDTFASFLSVLLFRHPGFLIVRCLFPVTLPTFPTSSLPFPTPRSNFIRVSVFRAWGGCLPVGLFNIFISAYV